MKDRRVCILASMGWGVRNVLMSRAMDLIRQRCEVHVFSLFQQIEAFRRRFAHLDRLNEILDAEMRRPMRLLYDWNVLAFYRISPSATHRYKVSRKREKQRLKQEKQKEWAKAKVVKPVRDPEPIGLRRFVSMGKLRSVAYRLTGQFLEKFTLRFGCRPLYRVTRRLFTESFRYGNRYMKYRQYFKEHRIDTVISSNPLLPTEYPALLAAKDMGLRTVAIITSWDNLTSKRPLIVDFDEYAVWNQIMAQEAKTYYHASDEQIHEIGPLQFDYYFDERFIDSRQTFCRQLGLDPGKKIVVYSTVTRLLLRDEPQIVEKLLLALKEGRVTGSPNLLIRLHPKRELKEFESVMADKRWEGMRVAWTEAGKPISGKYDLWCPMDEEIRLLTNTVRHGDVNLNCFSTMMLDFAILDKPAVLICHTAADKKLHYEIYEHLQPVLACKGHRIGYAFEETLAYLNEYLEHPELDAAGRAALVEMQCGPCLGQAWKRLADVVLNGRVCPGGGPRRVERRQPAPERTQPVPAG